MTPSSAPALKVDREAGTLVLVRAVGSPDDPGSRAAAHRHELLSLVARHGAVLVRGLELRDTGQVSDAFRALTTSLLVEREAFAPRQRLAEGVYSSVRWPAQQPMCMHHELSYVLQPPALMLFACLDAPEAGGATALADAAAVLDALPVDLVRRFEEVGWTLTRAYNDELGASLVESFGTDDRRAIERYCVANDIELDWRPDGSLHTRQRRPAVVRHRATGRRCWFNQVAFLSRWTLDPEVREYLVEEYGVDGLPFDTQYGDGAEIGADTVELINSVYDALSVREPWQQGDLMLVDNVRTAHSREAYRGSREVIVGMGRQADVSADEPTAEGHPR
jgi:alpha-ketoglutarate-dependent taurine dioxygenase